MNGRPTVINPKLLEMLASRSTTPWRIIEQAGVGRAHGAMVFAGRRAGRNTRKVLAHYLLPAELKVLGWDVSNTQTLEEKIYAREDEAIDQVMDMLAAYQRNRKPVMKLCGLVEEHPEIFGAVAEGESYLERLAEWVEGKVQGPQSKVQSSPHPQPLSPLPSEGNAERVALEVAA